MRRAATAVLAAAALAAAVPAQAAAHPDPAYSHDRTVGLSAPDWLRGLPDARRLSELSLPGTHDSGAYVRGGDITVTQSMDLRTQLDSGVRAWDVRLDWKGGRLVVHHGIVEQGQDFERDVLGTAGAFLAAHPGETVVMRVKKENAADPGFDAAVREVLARFPRQYLGADDNPTLGQLRGKVLVLTDYATSSPDGVPWGGLMIQDYWQLKHNWDLATKWRLVERHLADTRAADPGRLSATFLSGSTGSFPYFVASGHSSPQTGAPRLLTGWTRGVVNTCGGASACLPEYPSVNCFLGTCSVAFEGTNTLMTGLLGRAGGRAGIVFADFPGAGLIKAVIDTNSR